MSRETAQRPGPWLPQEQTTFVGRTAELARLGAMLTSARLVTVTGTGGVGKTRLALRAAETARTAFPDGVRLVELSGLRAPELLANTVAAALELPEQDPRPRLDQILGYLSGRRLLLVLDTCEHLVEACALFAEAAVTRTSGVTILATSREPLSVPGEHEYPLAPLTVPGPRSDPDGLGLLPATRRPAEGPAGGAGGDGAAASDAVELFAQRAAAVVPQFRAVGGTRADMVRLCRQLDGIPLAIELAAVQLRDFSLGELARRLDRRFLDLSGGGLSGDDRAGRRTDADGRHQTLRDAIGWSYELCTPAERALWERMAVFAGPADIEAARQVCAGPGLAPEAVRDTLIGLVDKSVLARADGTSRYRMLDTLREYGGERLAVSGAERQVRARHLRRYLGMAADFTARPLERQLSKYQALSAEHSDLRAALEYAATLPDTTEPDTSGGQPALQLPASLDWYWVISGRMQEGRYWLTKGLDRVPDAGADRVRALVTRGYLTAYQGELQAGIADAEAGVALADEIGDRQAEAYGLVYLAYIQVAASRFEEADTTAAAADRLLGPEDAQTGLPTVLGTVRAYIALLTGDPEGCLRRCEQTLNQMPSDGGERWASGYLSGLGGLALCLLGRPDEGNGPMLRGLAMKRELGDAIGVSHLLGAAALVAGAQQRHERAAWLIGATGPLWDKVGPAFVGVDVMQALTDQAAADARAVLGDDRYAEVALDGASLPVDQVIDLAVRDADRLPVLRAKGSET